MNKGILIIVLVMLGFVGFNPVFASELTDDYFDIANNYYNANNYAKSLEYLNAILKIEPNNVEAKCLRDKISPPSEDNSMSPQITATMLNNTQNPQNFVVLDVPQADTEKMAFNSDYYNCKGQEFYQKKEFDMAIEYFYKAIALNKCNAQAYNNLAMSYWFKNNTDCAIKYFKKANSINKCFTQPLVNLAMLYKQLGNNCKQLYYLNKAVSLNPNDYLAYYWLGDYYRNIGAYPQAISDFKEVIKINPKFSQAYLDLAVCFFETEQFNYTLMALNQYTELCPESDFVYYLMARTYLANCNYEEARIYILKAIQLDNKSEYEFELAKIEYYLADYDNALDTFQDMLKSGGASAEIFNYVGLCNYKLKNIEISIANFNKAIELDPLRPIYYYNLAQCYKSLGDKRNYAKYVNTATKITPINYQDFIDLSYIYYDNSNPGYAINSLNDAIRRYPCIKSLYLAKLKIYESLGDNMHYNETRDLIEARFNKK